MEPRQREGDVSGDGKESVTMKANRAARFDGSIRRTRREEEGSVQDHRVCSTGVHTRMDVCTADAVAPPWAHLVANNFAAIAALLLCRDKHGTCVAAALLSPHGHWPRPPSALTQTKTEERSGTLTLKRLRPQQGAGAGSCPPSSPAVDPAPIVARSPCRVSRGTRRKKRNPPFEWTARKEGEWEHRFQDTTE